MSEEVEGEVSMDSSIDPGNSYSIRYEGGDADAHQVDLSQLGQSLQGFARILAVCGHFIQTGKYNKSYQALSVQVYASPVEEHNCYEIFASIKSLVGSKEIWSGIGGVLLTLLVNHVFVRRREEEMKYLSEALKQALGQTAATQDRLLGTLEKMADALRPAAKQAMIPVGRSCKSIAIQKYGRADSKIILGQDIKDALDTPTRTAIDASKEYMGIISEMDMETGACLVSLAEDERDAKRITAVITDPVGQTPDNPYALAMAALRPLKFMAKAEVDSDGEIVKLYISDVVV